MKLNMDLNNKIMILIIGTIMFVSSNAYAEKTKNPSATQQQQKGSFTYEHKADDFDPVDEMDHMQARLQNLLENLMGQDYRLSTGLKRIPKDVDFAPDYDLIETDSHYEARFDLPGMNKEKIDIELKEQILTISGARVPLGNEAPDSFLYQSRSFGRFQRKIQLPENIDANQIKAAFENGVLSLKIPKVEIPEPQPQKIEIV